MRSPLTVDSGSCGSTSLDSCLPDSDSDSDGAFGDRDLAGGGSCVVGEGGKFRGRPPLTEDCVFSGSGGVVVLRTVCSTGGLGCCLFADWTGSTVLIDVDRRGMGGGGGVLVALFSLLRSSFCPFDGRLSPVDCGLLDSESSFSGRGPAGGSWVECLGDVGEFSVFVVLAADFSGSGGCVVVRELGRCLFDGWTTLILLDRFGTGGGGGLEEFKVLEVRASECGLAGPGARGDVVVFVRAAVLEPSEVQSLFGGWTLLVLLDRFGT